MTQSETFAAWADQQASTSNAKLLRDYEELGARRMQVVLLRRALASYGAHKDYCIGSDRCRCGLADALRIGSDAAQACGLKEEL